jgi:hypothetical protein
MIFATASITSTAIAQLPRSPQRYSVQFPEGSGSFDVIDGVPYLLRKGERINPGQAIDVIKKSRLVHYGTRRALAYPLDGDSPFVSLADEGHSAEWRLGFISDRSTFPVIAATGKFKGWYLDWSDEEIELAVNGKTVHARRLVLIEKPVSVKKLRCYPVAP